MVFGSKLSFRNHLTGFRVPRNGSVFENSDRKPLTVFSETIKQFSKSKSYPRKPFLFWKPSRKLKACRQQPFGFQQLFFRNLLGFWGSETLKAYASILAWFPNISRKPFEISKVLETYEFPRKCLGNPLNIVENRTSIKISSFSFSRCHCKITFLGINRQL